MDRRRFLGLLGAGALPLLLPGGSVHGPAVPGGRRRTPRMLPGRAVRGDEQERKLAHPRAATLDFTSLEWPEEKWRTLLSPEAFRVLLGEGTEPRGSSPLLEEGRRGTYLCAACRLPLFDSSDKFESGTGWPSFTRPLAGRHLETKRDFKLILPRTEYHCARCGGHQGHLFDDGPPPTGERWCNNGVALSFVPSDEELPPLRG